MYELKVCCPQCAHFYPDQFDDTRNQCRYLNGAVTVCGGASRECDVKVWFSGGMDGSIVVIIGVSVVVLCAPVRESVRANLFNQLFAPCFCQEAFEHLVPSDVRLPLCCWCIAARAMDGMFWVCVTVPLVYCFQEPCLEISWCVRLLEILL